MGRWHARRRAQHQDGPSASSRRSFALTREEPLRYARPSSPATRCPARGYGVQAALRA